MDVDDDFKGIDKNIDNAGSGCLWLILIVIVICVYNLVF